MADLFDYEQNPTGSFLQESAEGLLQVCLDGASPQSEFQPAMADHRPYKMAWSFTIVDVVFIRVPTNLAIPQLARQEPSPVARASLKHPLANGLSILIANAVYLQAVTREG